MKDLPQRLPLAPAIRNRRSLTPTDSWRGGGLAHKKKNSLQIL
jgi:hypothetical protein